MTSGGQQQNKRTSHPLNVAWSSSGQRSSSFTAVCVVI
jgi:hypothetical protein